MKTTLDQKKGFLCVLAEFEISNGPDTRALVKEWYPVHRADEAEIRTLLGRPLTRADSDEGIYLDEEGNVFQLAKKGSTEPIEVERSSVGRKEADAARSEGSSAQAITSSESVSSGNHRSNGRKTQRPRIGKKASTPRDNSLGSPGARDEGEPHEQHADSALESPTFAHLNLRQKLALVRRRIGYLQKRGHNDRYNYNYVTAADIAGAVGDVLAELGVVMIPQLQSISTETARSSSERIARVVMNYRFLDARSGEGLTVRVAGEGADAGDKAPYKAMTGALKYALLQSFLIATGDDPENESAQSHYGRGSQPRTITEQAAKAIYELLEKTGTKLERVLEYYKVSSVEEMTEATYRRAMETLGKKLALMERREAACNGQG